MPAGTVKSSRSLQVLFRPADAIRLVLPKEHGSWSLALEPIVLGLLVASSWAGIPLAIAAITGFFMRRPVKLLLQDKPDPRRPLAAICAGVLLFIAAASLLLAMELGGATRLWPLIPAVFAGGLFVWFDARGSNREGAAEIAGSAAFACLPAAFTTLAGWSMECSLALAAVMLARSVPTVILVRTFLRRRKNSPASNGLVWLTSIAASGILFWLASRALVPWAVALFAILFVARAGWYLSGPAARLTARQIGFAEFLLGLAWVILVAISWLGV